MSLEAALYDILSSASGVTALVGGSLSPRIYPIGIPQGKAGAAVVYQQISAVDDVTCDGHLGLRSDRIQVTCWSAQAGAPADARALAAAVCAALLAASGSHGSMTVYYVSFLDERDIYEPGESQREARYGKQQDWEIAYD